MNHAVLLRRKHVRAQVQVIPLMVNQLEWQHNFSSLTPGVLRRNANSRHPHAAKSSLSLTGCATILRMPRFPAILVVIAMLATPLALLARGLACDSSECDCMAMCQRQAAQDRHLCGAVKHAPMCGTHQGRHAIDYGFIAPIAPTAPLPPAQLALPALSSEFLTPYTQFAVTGFASAPFEPPRS